MSRGLNLTVAVVVAIATASCGPSPITPDRIQAAIAPTFANLVRVQVSWLGLPPMAASDFAVTASCRKPSAGNGRANSGAGDWACTLLWQGPDRRTLRDTYDLFVNTDGCYMATVAGESLGGPTLKGPNGTEVRNLLYAFEGCFDTT
jgi:hypothetical protein